MTETEQTLEGIRLYTKIRGFGSSSTRTELAAGIKAISAYGSVHIGSDSRAFVDKASQYLKDIRNNRMIKRPWELVSDGDLWERFYKAVSTKGVNSVKITWVKGHATQQHIDHATIDGCLRIWRTPRRKLHFRQGGKNHW